MLNRNIQLKVVSLVKPSAPPPPVTYLYSGVERGTMRVKWSAQEYDALTRPGPEQNEPFVMAPRPPQVEMGVT